MERRTKILLVLYMVFIVPSALVHVFTYEYMTSGKSILAYHRYADVMLVHGTYPVDGRALGAPYIIKEKQATPVEAITISGEVYTYDRRIGHIVASPAEEITINSETYTPGSVINIENGLLVIGLAVGFIGLLALIGYASTKMHTSKTTV